MASLPDGEPGLEDHLRSICRAEGLEGRSIQALSGGQVNQVFLVDGAYVLRVGRRENALERLSHETELLRSFSGQIPVARVHAFGQQAGLVYQIQQRLPGQKLYLLWKDYPPEVQKAITAELAAALKVIHSRPAAYFGYAHPQAGRYSRWADFLLDKFNRTVDELKALKIRMAPGFVELAQRFVDDHRHVLEGGAPALVHGDLSLVNLLADRGRLSAILDFEYALHAPRDYELWVMEAFCLYPNDWAEEEHETYCTADFSSLIPLLRGQYPDLFQIPHLRERMNLYHIDAALGSYLAWRKDNLDAIPPDRMAARTFYMARIANFVFEQGVRLFLD